MVQKLALAITIIGALNWGVIGLFSFDVVAQFADGHAQPLARFFYIIVGVSGLIITRIAFRYIARERIWRMSLVAEPEEV